MRFEKEDMIGSYYEWPAGDQGTVFYGEPSRRAFDKFNGEQVLFIINFYCSVMDNLSIIEGRKIEHEILNHLPLDAKSEISVYNWIKDNCVSNKNPVK